MAERESWHSIESVPRLLVSKKAANRICSSRIELLGKAGRILGATIVAPHAGELICLWGLAISKRLNIGAIASLVFPYPTISEISKKTAAMYYTPTLFGRPTRALVGLIQRFLP